MNNVHRIKEWTKYTELKNEECTLNLGVIKKHRIKECARYTELKNEQSTQK